MKPASLFQYLATAALALLLVAGSLELHADAHEPGMQNGPAEVFAAARHLQDAAHLEATGPAVLRFCPACVLLKTPREMALPCRAAAPTTPSRPLITALVAAQHESRPWSRAPRGPPLS